MQLTELLDNPDYVNANEATKKAIFEKYSKDSTDYVTANAETRQAIHQKFGLSGVNVTEPLPEKITDFSGRDFGNMVKQSFSEANKQLAKGGRTGVVGPAVLGAVGETIKGIGAIGELATDKAQGITKVGQAITQGAQEANMPAAMVGQVGSYIAPYKLAQKGIQSTVGAVPYLRGAVNPATFLGSTGEMAGAGALVGGLTTPGSAEERMNEAAMQAMYGAGANAAIRTGVGAYQGGKAYAQGAKNAINAEFGTPGARTAFTEVGQKAYPTSAVDPYMSLTPAQQAEASRLAALDQTLVDTKSLFPKLTDKLAYNLAETGPTGGKLIPTQGRPLMEAYGEQGMRNLQKPITDLSGIGGNLAGAATGALAGSAFAPGVGTVIGGIGGFLAPQIKRAGELWKLSHLKGVANLNPEFESALKQARTAGAVAPPTPQTMAAAQVNPAMATTPAAQAAVNTTQAKAQKSQFSASGNYDVNTGKGSVKINTPLGPMTVRFGKNGEPIVEPIVKPQTAPPVQTTGAVASSGPSYNVPTQTVPQAKPFSRPMPAQTTMAMPTTGPATPMPMKPMATPISEPQYTGYKIAEPQTFTKVQKQLEPTANTPLIEQALAEKVAANPKLQEFSKPYITPDNLKEPIGKFLSNETPSIIAEGGPGTGKSSLAQEWKRLNPEGHLVKITANSLKDSKTLNTILEKAKTQANDKLLFLIDEADTFTNPGKSTALKHLNTLKTEMDKYGNNVKFLYTTNDVKNVPKFINDVPVVKVDTKLSPDERSTYALKIARDYNVNKTPAEIQAIADDARLTNFRDVKKAISEGYSFKEPPIFSYAKSAEKLMPNTPKNITSTLDNFVNNELDRNVLIFDSSAYAKDPQLSAKLKNYVTKNSSEFNVNDLSERLLKGNSAGGDPIRIIVNKDNLSDIKALKSEFEIGNEKLHPWNFILEDPSNLLIGKESLPLRSRAHVIDGKMWNNVKPAVDAKTVDLATAIKSGVDKGFVKTPTQSEPVVFKGKTYTSGAEMRKDLKKQGISAYDIDKLMNKYYPGE